MTRDSLELAAHRLVSREAAVDDVEALLRADRAGEPVLPLLLDLARDDAEARAELDARLSGAGDVALPRRPVPSIRPLRWTGATGWLAAAVVALLWLGFGLSASRPAPAPLSGAALTTAEALDRYIAAGVLEGRIIAELPTVMVQSRPLDDGAEILYVRRVLERAVVSEIIEQDVDDAGRIVERPVSPSRFAAPQQL
ncbi:MAG: hypothetical protein ACF8R7_13785 [Phycisphaerales bacterium JB039]